MDGARWESVKEIFAAALEREPAERAAYLDAACGKDTQLRSEVESLLESHSADDDFIERPAARLALGDQVDTPPPSWIGRRLGVYRLVEEIGRGGMSEVFKAVRDDDEYHKVVAVKILRRGYDTEQLLRRFKVETQILATLDHPNIARLLDAGTTEERLPYLVMDYIEGLPIDAYCSQNRCDVNERLELFRQLCGAVHYVHQHLMVHGDLKCGNVLVTSDGSVKLLDFGIARLLNPDAAFGVIRDAKLTGLLALTPEYASPEQIQGKPITTTSDVYSLGVVLYRLLTGVLPFRIRDGLSYDLARQICETEPLTPNVAAELNESGETSGFWRRLHGDLDNIVLMALEKDPARRYASAEALSEDIRRHLQGFPVKARSASWSYQLVKFVGRHKALMTAGVALVASLVGGIVTTTWMADVAWDQRARAERHFNEVRKLANTFMFDVHGAIENLPGSTPARQMLVMNSLQYLDALATESAHDPTLERELAAAYEKVADLQGGFRTANLGDTDGAIASYRKALQIRQRLAARDPDPNLQRELLRNHGKLGETLAANGDREGALDNLRNTLRIAEQLAESAVATPADRRNLGNAYLSLGRQMTEPEEVERSLLLMNRGAAVFETLVDADPKDVITRSNLAIAYGEIGARLNSDTTRYADALQMHESALHIARELHAADPRNSRLSKIEGYALIGMGEALAKLGRPRPALDRQLQAVSLLRALLELDPDNEEARFDAANALMHASGTFARIADHEAAKRYLEDAVQILTGSSLLAEGELTNTKVLLGLSYFGLGQAIAQRAADASLGQRERTRLCEQAQLHFERSVPILTAAEQQDRFRGQTLGKVSRIADEMRSCSAIRTAAAEVG